MHWHNHLFLFLNDLVDFISHGFDGLSDLTNDVHLLFDDDDVETYFKLYLLLYADDAKYAQLEVCATGY